MLEQLDNNIWVYNKTFHIMGMNAGSRMTVIKLQDGRLFLHSPVQWDEDVRRTLQNLGDVRYLAAPNCYHHLFLQDYLNYYTGAELYIAPGLESKRKDLQYKAILQDNMQVDWSAEVDHLLIQGARKLNEVAFFHNASRTLILTDFIFNFHHSDSFLLSLYLKFNRALGQVASSKLVKFLTKDKQKAKQSIEKILQWDFDKVVVSHGELIRSDAKQTLIKALAWLS